MPRPKSSIRSLQEIADKFWVRVKRTPKESKDCWPWMGKPMKSGYGQLQCRGLSQAPLYTHRIAWELTYGPIPEDKHVLHHCDNPICVRPDHLFLGDQAANNADRDKKGRVASGDRNGARTKRDKNSFVKNRGSGLSGEKHPMAKLSDADVALLRQQWTNGVYRTRTELAKAFNISGEHVTRLLSGCSRKEVGNA